MTRPVVWLPEAAAELNHAMKWYADISPGLAARFAHSVDETVQRIAEAPLQFAVRSKARRRAGIPRFPYGLFFLVEESLIVVIACFHGKRNPQRWQTRQPTGGPI